MTVKERIDFDELCQRADMQSIGDVKFLRRVADKEYDALTRRERIQLSKIRDRYTYLWEERL